MKLSTQHTAIDTAIAPGSEHVRFQSLRLTSFKALECLSYLFGVDKRMVTLMQAYRAIDVAWAYRSMAGTDQRLIEQTQRAVAYGACAALEEYALREPARMLVTARRLAAGAARDYQRLEAEAVEVLVGDPNARSEAVKMLAAIVRTDMIPELEAIVAGVEAARNLLQIGCRLEGSKLYLESPPMSIDSPPKTLLLNIGNTALRGAIVEQIGAAINPDANEKLSTVQRTYARVLEHSKRTSPNLDSDDSGMYDVLWSVIFGARWAMCGFPLLQPTHTVAASNMMTSIPDELVPEIAIPWSSFVIDIPHGLLEEDIAFVTVTHMSEIENVEKSLSLSVGKDNDGLVIGLFNSVNARHERFVVSELRHLNNLDLDKNVKRIGTGHTPETRTSPAARRTLELLGRLVLSTLIELDSEEHKTTLGRAAPDPMSNDRVKRGDKAPAQWTFVIRRPIQVDTRSAVREYIRSGTHSVGVQTLVRGHKKRQPYGPRGSLRKWIVVEPHWRGPEDAPIAIRPHRLGSEVPS